MANLPKLPALPKGGKKAPPKGGRVGSKANAHGDKKVGKYC